MRLDDLRNMMMPKKGAYQNVGSIQDTRCLPKHMVRRLWPAGREQSHTFGPQRCPVTRDPLTFFLLRRNLAWSVGFQRESQHTQARLLVHRLWNVLVRCWALNSPPGPRDVRGQLLIPVYHAAPSPSIGIFGPQTQPQAKVLLNNLSYLSLKIDSETDPTTHLEKPRRGYMVQQNNHRALATKWAPGETMPTHAL